MITQEFSITNDEEIISASELFDEEEEKSEPSPKMRRDTFKGDKFCGTKLFNKPYDEIPKLVDPIFPKVGVVAIVGSSDTGKSTILRQLAISVALGLEDFIGYKLNSDSRNVICIITEDDTFSTSVSIKKVANYMKQAVNANLNNLDHIKFIFDVDSDPQSPDYIIKALRKDLESVDTDLIIIDAFTDVFSGEINSSTKVREFLNLFSKIAKEFNCLVVFLHHTGKGKDKTSASKDNILGSQAFEAKMRAVLELRKHQGNDSLRQLVITKGNYLSSEIKKQAKILKFDEKNLIFEIHQDNVMASELGAISKTHSQKSEILDEIRALPANTPVRKIADILKAKGFTISKSTVDNYLKEMKANKS